MKRTWSFIFALAIAMQFAALALADKDPSPPVPDAAYIQSFDKWKAELVDDLKTNWLSLAGLFWLKSGDNSFGSDAGNAIVLPKGPAHAGVFELQGTDVTVNFGSDAHATIDGKPVTTAKLQPDNRGTGKFAHQSHRAGSANRHSVEGSRQRAGQELPRPDFLPARPVLPCDRDLGTLRGKENGGCAQRSRRHHTHTGGRDSRF